MDTQISMQDHTDKAFSPQLEHKERTGKVTIRTSDKESPKRLIASPLARRLARERNFDLGEIGVGSGPNGRIVKDDVIDAFNEMQSGDSPSRMNMSSNCEEIPLVGTRKLIAERMVLSSRTAPHFSLMISTNMTNLLKTRNKINNQRKLENLPPISITAFMVKLCAWTLPKHPLINATIVEDKIRLIPNVDIGVAVAREEGLIVPVIRNADSLGLAEISDQLTDLINRAKSCALKVNEAHGSSFTISNLGMYGVDQFTAIINPPESAILALGAINRQIVPVSNEEIRIQSLMKMTLSCDHRVIDGAIGGKFLMDLVNAIEDPGLVLT
jgi:pyruvate dehydrogenase E2 component (dihydrolipoamide acetyltransferase)